MSYIYVQFRQLISSASKLSKIFAIFDIQLVQFIVGAVQTFQVLMRHIQLLQFVVRAIQNSDIGVLTQVKLGQLVVFTVQIFQFCILT